MKEKFRYLVKKGENFYGRVSNKTEGEKGTRPHPFFPAKKNAFSGRNSKVLLTFPTNEHSGIVGFDSE